MIENEDMKIPKYSGGRGSGRGRGGGGKAIKSKREGRCLFVFQKSY